MTVWLLFATTLLSGFVITRIPHEVAARVAAWMLVAGTFIGAERVTAAESASTRMMIIVLALIWAFKAVVSVEERISRGLTLQPLNWFLFAIGWVGMRPSEFAQLPGRSRGGSTDLLKRGAAALAVGVILVAAARFAWTAWPDAGGKVGFAFVTALLLTGLCLVLNFGLFNIAAAIWRRLGAECHSLFRAPLKSKSLREFWSRRWNLAFAEMAAIGVFRPLRTVTGPHGATLAVFLLSGLLHEMAMSVPVRAGFGLPTLYFLLHAVALSLEKSLGRLGYAVDQIPWLGRLWTAGWVLLPLPLLFHAPFLYGCLGPIIGMSR